MNEYDELLTGNQPKPRNEYDAVLQEQSGSQQTALRASMQVAASTTPDRAAQAIKLSERTKLPLNVVERNFDDLSKKYDLSDNEYDSMLRENPKLSAWLLDASNAAVARDDLPLMRRIENTFASFGRGWSKAGIQSELADILSKEKDLALGDGNLSPQDRARLDKLKGDVMYLTRQDTQNGIPEYVSGVTGYSARQMGSSLYEGAKGAAYGGVTGALAGSVLPGVGTVAGGAAGVAAGAASTLSMYSYRMESAFAYDDLRSMKDINDNTIDRKLAANVANGIGVVNALIEAGSDVALATLIPGFGNMVSGLSKDAAKQVVRRQAMDALKVPTTRAALASAVGKMGAAGSIEGIEEFLQSLVGAGGREIAQGASGQAFKPDDITDDIRKAAGEALDAAIGTFFTFAPVGGARFYQLQRQAQKAQEQEQFFSALGQGVAGSKTYERLPEKMQDFISQATKDGPIDKVYVPVEQWSTYWQNKGIDPASAAEEVIGNTTMYESSVQSGADLVIPMDRFATRIAPTEHGAFFAAEARLAPDEMNAREAKELEATLAAEQQKADQERQAQAEQKAAVADVDAVMTNLRDDIKQKLIAAGVEQRTAEDYAVAQEARFRQFADRAGISAEALFERFVKGDKLTVGAGETQGDGAQMMSQTDKPDPTQDEVIAWSKGVQQKLGLEDFGVYVVDGRLNLSLMVVPRDKRKAGVGTAAMQELTAYADENGMPIILSPADRGDRWGTTSSARLKEFYKRFGFVENKGRNKDFSHKEAMYRMPKGGKLNQAAIDDGGAEPTINVDGQDRPTTNSKGQPIAATVEALQNFWRWFVDSKVVDAQGRPLVVYHGAAESFDEFEHDRPGKKDSGWLGRGFYFTNDVEIANSYTNIKPGDQRNVMPVYLRIESPHMATVEEKRAGQFAEMRGERSTIKTDGGDGVILNYAHVENGKSPTEYVVFKPEQIKSAIGNLGTFDPLSASILNQPPEQDAKRGSITFTNGNDRRFKIDLLEGADLSTFIHESGHFWLEVMGDLVQELRTGPAEKLNDKQRKMMEDYDALLKWMGVSSRAEIGVEQHEQFARGIEAYFMEGKSPSPALQNLFARVRSWMVAIYQSLTKLNVSLTPEVRDVFDRMLASDQEIEAAQAEANVSPLFADDKTLLDAGFSPEFVFAYRNKVQAASDSAKRELQEKVMRAMTREREKWWKDERSKVRDAVAEEVNARQEQIALSVLTRDVMPNGDPLPYDMQRVKIRRSDVDAMYGEDAWKTLPRGSTATDGLPMAAVADLFGYTSGDALVKAVRQAKPANVVIETETDSRMKEMHGDMLVDGTIHAAAQQAVQNEERIAVIQAELRALSKLRAAAAPAVALERRQAAQERQAGVQAMRAAVPPLAAVRQMAAGRISLTKVSDLTPNTYLVAARRASLAAIEAAAKGDYELALSAKQREMLNVELFKASTAAREEVDKTVDYMQSFGENKKRGRVAKAGQDYLDQIDGFLDRYDFARVTQKALDRRKSLAAWVAQKEKEGEPVNLPDDVVVEKRTNYKDMTVEELRGVRDSVKHIEHMARLKNKLLASKAKQELDEAIEDGEQSIRENGGKARKPPVETKLPQDQAMRALDSGFAWLRKLSSIARELDGFKDGGWMWEYFVRPINAAGDAETSKNIASTKKFMSIFNAAYPGKEASKLYEKKEIPAIGNSLSRMARIMIALNWGTLDNRQRVMSGGLDGRNSITDVQVEAILAGLDERDWKFVREVWDLINSFWSEIEAKEKRVNGIAPEKVNGVPVVTKFGVFDGAYFPLKYDPDKSEVAGAHYTAQQAKMMLDGGYTRSTTARGHTEERKQNVELPVRLDFGVISEHMQQVIHDLTHHEVLIDTNKLLRSKAIQNAIKDHYGVAPLKEIKNILNDIAVGNQPAKNWFESTMNHLRAGTTVAFLGWSAMTGLLQFTGITQSINRIGLKAVANGMSVWLRDAASMENSMTLIREKSSFMRDRGVTQMREISEIRNRIGLTTGRIGGWVNEVLLNTSFGKVDKQAIADSYFWLIYKGQQIVDIPTWLGAYEAAMADPKNDEARSIALADQAVIDSQGSGMMKDLAGPQRGGPMLKLWMNFYSYFSVTYQRVAESVKRTNPKNVMSIGRLMVDFLILTTLPATMAALMRQAITGPGDEDGDKIMAKVIQENISYLMGLIPGLREMEALGYVTARQVTGAELPGPTGYRGPAGARFFESIAKALTQTGQGDLDEAFWRSWNEVAGIVLHYPSAQVRRAVEGFNALSDGETKNPMVLLFGAPKQ